MLYRILADLIVTIHFAWILFMLTGFILTLRGFFHREFFEKWLFRVMHLIGVIYVNLLGLMGKFCPLTLWENILREKHNPSLTYPGSFIIHYVEKLVYPEVNPWIIYIPTIFITVFTIIIFILRPPAKIKKLFK